MIEPLAGFRVGVEKKFSTSTQAKSTIEATRVSRTSPIAFRLAKGEVLETRLN